MDKRREELTKLKSYTEGIDNELTMILQSLQWDRKHLLQNPVMVTCRHDSNHKVPPDKTEEHEMECFLRNNGYTKDDQLLPDPVDSESNTLVKLSKEEIEQIVGNASRLNPLFKKGVGCRGAEPMSLERLQSSYSADERCAIHDAVVSAVPSCHDLTDLALLSGGDDQKSKVILSRTEILVELRNMRRRRTKYRVAAKSRNYSDVLRDVIKTQMEHFNDGHSENTPKETADEQNNQTHRHNDSRHSRQGSKDDDRYSHERRTRVIPRPIEIKTEKEDSTNRNRDYSRERADRAFRYEEGHRDTRDRGLERHRYNEKSRERRNDERSQKYPEHSRKRKYEEDSEKDYKYNERTVERIHQKSKERKKDDDIQSKAEKKSHKHREIDRMYQVKQEPGLDDDRNNRHRERRGDENRDKIYKQKDRTTERRHDEDRRRDRGRSSERRQHHRHEERSSERIHVKQEREDSATRQDKSYKKDKAKDRRRKSNDRRNDRSYRGRSNDSYSSEKTIIQGTYDRYYDRPSGEVYDPNKKIKVEK